MMAHYSEQQGNWKPLKGDTDNTLRHNLPNRHHGGVNSHLRAGSAESPILVRVFRGNERPHVSPNVDDSIPRFVLVPFPNCGCYGFFLLLYSGRGFSSFYRMIAHMFFFTAAVPSWVPTAAAAESTDQKCPCLVAVWFSNILLWLFSLYFYRWPPGVVSLGKWFSDAV